MVKSLSYILLLMVREQVGTGTLIHTAVFCFLFLVFLFCFVFVFSNLDLSVAS